MNGKNVASQTFQVLRLPWMAAEIAPGNPRHFLHPWRSEVLEPPGAAPVKIWKVSALCTNNDLEK